MTLPVKLADVVEQLSIVSESISVYLNRRTGEFVVLSSDDTLGFEDEYDFAQATSPDEPDWLEDEPEWSKEEHRLRREILNSSDYIPLPDKFDIHDWQIMEDFCRSVRKNPLREQLLGLIKGKGAFGRFNSAIRTFGIDNAWLEFREQAYRRIAVDWLEENEIGFIDDCQLPIANSAAANVTSDANTSGGKSIGMKGTNVGTTATRSMIHQAQMSNTGAQDVTQKKESKADEIKVFISHRDSKCDECGEDLGRQAWITLERDKGALCLACADLDELVFLPSGDAALTRRSRKYSTLSAVVLKFSRARRQYERQGLLVEEAALDRAEVECLADSEVRERRNERARERRAELDEQYISEFAKRIRILFPHCPKGREQIIAQHACLKYSGRVGRSAAAKSFEDEVVRLAVVAHVRHRETNYDSLLARGDSRFEARAQVRDRVEAVIEKWQGL